MVVVGLSTHFLVSAYSQSPKVAKSPRLTLRSHLDCRGIGQGCRSGRGAGKAIELTWGGLRRVPILELREPQGDLTGAQESADGIVGHAVGTASEALQGRKAEPRIGQAGNDDRRPERLEVAGRIGNS